MSSAPCRYMFACRCPQLAWLEGGHVLKGYHFVGPCRPGGRWYRPVQALLWPQPSGSRARMDAPMICQAFGREFREADAQEDSQPSQGPCLDAAEFKPSLGFGRFVHGALQQLIDGIRHIFHRVRP
jgi:hypothetical protein